MDLVASQATRPAVPSAPVAPVAAPVAMVSPAPKAPVQAQRTKPSVKASESASPVPKSLSVKPIPTARENSQHVGSMSTQQVNGTAHVEAKSHSKTHLVGKESGKEQEVTTQTRPITSVAVSKGPKSPLLQAVEEGDLASVTKLLNARAEPNDYDREGETPLFTAASHGSPDVVATLLMCNAEPLTRSIRGRTPWDVASGDAICSLLNFFAGQVSSSMPILNFEFWEGFGLWVYLYFPRTSWKAIFTNRSRYVGAGKVNLSHCTVAILKFVSLFVEKSPKATTNHFAICLVVWQVWL